MFWDSLVDFFGKLVSNIYTHVEERDEQFNIKRSYKVCYIIC